jgi:hypothetical protein
LLQSRCVEGVGVSRLMEKSDGGIHTIPQSVNSSSLYNSTAAVMMYDDDVIHGAGGD